MFNSFLETRDFFTVQYHGTGFENAVDIIKNKQGVIPDRPLTTSGPGLKGVYITPNIKLAARYAVGGLSKGKIGRIPVILEIKLTDSRRHNKMSSDVLDTASSAWQRHEEIDTDESVHEIHDAIIDFLDKISKYYGFEAPKYLNIRMNYIEEFQNFNIHQYVRDALQHMLGTSRWNMIRNDINHYLNNNSSLTPGESFVNGKIIITNSGIMKLTPEYFHSQHQNVYQNKIPHMAVKFIWVRKSDFPDAPGEEKQFGNELLPSEVVDEFEKKKRTLEDLGQEIKKIIDEDDIDGSIEELEGIKQDLEDDYLIEMIDELIEKIENNNFDYDFIDKIGDKGMEFAGYLYDDYNSSKKVEKDKTTWIRVNPKDFVQLRVNKV